MEFEKRVEEIREHFGGLIDEDTAVLLAEYSLEMGKGVQAEKTPGFEKITGLAVSKKVIQEKKYCRIDVKDETGVVPVYFWDEAYGVAANDIFPGMKVEVLSRKGESGYHVSSADYISFEIIESEIKKVSEIKKGSGVSVRGFVSGIEGVRETKNGKKIAVFVITDGKSFVQLVLWDDKVEYADVIAPGDEVIVLNAYVNEYGGRINIHAGKNSLVDVRKIKI